jgi:hypothetical protein
VKFGLVQVPTISLLLVGPASATGSLDFQAGGYTFSMAISLESASVTGPIRCSTPGAKAPFTVQQSAFKVLRCNTKAQRFRAVLVNRSDPRLPESFTLTVHGSKGLLLVANKRIPFTADWLLQ